MIICCGIDGVLADVRDYVIKYLPRDWKTYFSHTAEFLAIDETLRLLGTLMFSFSHEVRVVTGRPESNREPTERWLLKYIGVVPDLLMRANDDHRTTCEIKMDWFRELKPDLIIDDDPEVVRAAVAQGFTVLQVHGFRCTEKDGIPENFLVEKES